MLCFVLVQLRFSLKDEHSTFVRSQLACNCRKKKRVNWAELNTRISCSQFRRMFRMTRPCFKLLCQNIIAAVGESTFKSEVYIPYFLDQPYTFQCSCQVSIYLAQKEASGGYLCGEVKLAITLRILAGGDSLDLGALFDISPCYCKNILNYVLLNEGGIHEI